MRSGAKTADQGLVVEALNVSEELEIGMGTRAT